VRTRGVGGWWSWRLEESGQRQKEFVAAKGVSVSTLSLPHSNPGSHCIG
jgi:hypothetical protein